MKKGFWFIMLFLLPALIWAQKSDTLKIKKHNSKVAVYLSLAVPGAGQVYNGQWYKVPFFYAGLWYTSYMFQQYNIEYWKVRNDIMTVMNNFGPEVTFNKTTDINQLQSIKETYRSRRDLNALLFLGVWALNVLDAYISAEFYNFDVSPDLSYVPGSYNKQGLLTVGIKFEF